jgi:GH25 family lysozyme M1 (1,4-beta-N-acetylmuramidase)
MFEPLVDVSKWQAEINAGKMLGAGTKGMYIRAGGTNWNNGASFTDRRFRENAGKFSHRIPVGYYYFFYPHIDGVKQAQYFCTLLKSVKWNLPPAVDVESNPKNANRSRFQTELKQFLDTVESELGVKSVIYTRATFWNPNVGAPAWATDYKLWVAIYSRSLKHPWANNPNSNFRPRPWNDWWLWQYSADGNGRGREFGVGSAAIDINRVNMTEAEFHTFAKWGTGAVDDSDGPVEITPPPDDEIEEPIASPIEVPESKYPFKAYLRRGYSALRLRSRPTAHESNIVGAIKRGYTFSVFRELPVGDDIWWLIELPDGTVGWGARRYNAVTYLEPDN